MNLRNCKLKHPIRTINRATRFASAPSVRVTTTIVFIIALISTAFSVSTAAAADRGRVRVLNGTVVTDRNTPLRGATDTLIPGVDRDWSFWRYLHEKLHLNAIRFGAKTDATRPIEQQLPALDKAVDAAAANNMYLMINNSTRRGEYNLSELIKFWSVVAPRYKNRTHVFYEMTNEPTQGGPHWGDASQYTDKVRADLMTVYRLMRAAAPDTHIVMFSGGNLYPDCNTYAAMVAKMRGIDWNKTSIGFHHYAGTAKFGEPGLICLKYRYPLIMTETSFWIAPFYFLEFALNRYEKLGISWFSLDGKAGRANHLRDEIIPNLKSAGYTWPME